MNNVLANYKKTIDGKISVYEQLIDKKIWK